MQSYPFQHIFWDWNGTLLADAELCAEVDSVLLARRGLPPITVETLRAHFGFPMDSYYRAIGFDLEKWPLPSIGKEFVEHYEARKDSCSLQEGALDLMQRFKTRGFKQSILSACLQKTLVEMLKAYELDPFLEHISGHDSICPDSKLEQGRKLLAKTGLQAESVLIIGDTEHDAEVARQLGTRCLLVANGHCSEERLKRCGYEVFGSLRELGRELLA